VNGGEFVLMGKEVVLVYFEVLHQRLHRSNRRVVSVSGSTQLRRGQK
jgi:hypothetical protein